MAWERTGQLQRRALPSQMRQRWVLGAGCSPRLSSASPSRRAPKSLSLSRLWCRAGLAEHTGRRKRRFLLSVSAGISKGRRIIHLRYRAPISPADPPPCSGAARSLPAPGIRDRPGINLADGPHCQLITEEPLARSFGLAPGYTFLLIS